MATSAQTIVDAIDAEIYRRANGGTPASYAINGRSLQHMGIDELLSARKYYANVAAQASAASNTAAGSFPFQLIGIRPGSASS